MTGENEVKCPNCGAEVSKDTDKCPECGADPDNDDTDIEKVLNMVDEKTFEIKNGDSESVVSHIKRFADQDVEKKEIKEYPPEEDISDAVGEERESEEETKEKVKEKQKTRQKDIQRKDTPDKGTMPPPPPDKKGKKSKTSEKSEGKTEKPKRKKKKLQFMCPLCGAEVDDEDDKCPGCGAIFE